jgi:archaellum component FlaG (FlaF/FlaG flagellin family)
MEKAIATVMLTVAGIVAIAAVINSLMPAISRTNASIIATSDSVDSRISTDLEIVHASGADGSLSLEAWVKNVGGGRIAPLERVDVFFGPSDAFTRLPPGEAGCTAPCWSFTLENDSAWNPTATLRITLSLETSLTTGATYYLKVVAPNGVSDARFFTV